MSAASHPPKRDETVVVCTWCGKENHYPATVRILSCAKCGLNPAVTPGMAKRKPSKSTEDTRSGHQAPQRKGGKPSRSPSPRRKPLSVSRKGQPVVGVDPGARYTGVVVRDGDLVLHASTLVRPAEVTDGTVWARMVVEQVQGIVRQFPTAPIAVEGISDPKGFYKGQRAAINPKDIIRAAIVLGAVVQAFPGAYVVAPGNNGSQHTSHYPESLVGRRPPTLPGESQGAGTRGHEQSAYDVAGKGAALAYPSEPPRLNIA